MKKTRILFFRNARGIVDVTGAESYIFNLMQALDGARAQSFLLAATQPDVPNPPWLQEVRRRGLPHQVVAVGSKFAMQDLFALRAAVQALEADVIHTVDHRADILGLLAARTTGRAFVASFFGWTNLQSATLKGRIYPWLDYRAQQAADALITDSAYIARVSGIDAGRAPVAVIHNGVNLQRFDPAATQPIFRRRWFEHDSALIFGMLGRVHPIKGQLDFVEMAAAVHTQFPNARFVILGAPPRGFEAYGEAVHEAVQRNGLSDKVLIDNVESAEVPQALRSLDVLVAPSYEESFSFTLLEAMCMGLPVLATDVGGNREMMVEGESGLLVPAGDVAALSSAAASLAGSAELRASLGAKARERVLDRFTVKRMADHTLEVYHQIVEWRKSGRRDRASLGARLAHLQNRGVTP